MAVFKPGQSGNPKGRGKGRPTRLTAAVRQQIAEGGDPIAYLQRIMAGEGIEQGEPDPEGRRGKVWPTLEQSIRAAVSLAHKICPDAKDRAIIFKVGKIEGPADALAAMARLTESMARGELTPAEATNVMSVIGLYLKAFEATELERRVNALENR